MKLHPAYCFQFHAVFFILLCFWLFKVIDCSLSHLKKKNSLAQLVFWLICCGSCSTILFYILLVLFCLSQEVKECNDQMEVVDKLAEASVGGLCCLLEELCYFLVLSSILPCQLSLCHKFDGWWVSSLSFSSLVVHPKFLLLCFVNTFYDVWKPRPICGIPSVLPLNVSSFLLYGHELEVASEELVFYSRPL